MAQLELKRILITGGTGFVGQSLVEALVHSGQRVRVFQRSQLPRGAELWRGVERVEGDVSDRKALEQAVRDVDAVIHAAGSRSGGAAQMWRSNALGSRQVAQAARAAGVRRFVHLSSAGVYGHSQGEAFREDSATQADDAYGYSKLEAERCVTEALGDSLAWVILRPFGIYGARRLDLFREVQRRKLWLYGPTQTIVHPTHVDDVVRASLRALERAEAPGVRGEIFNVAGERALAHAALVRLVAAELGVRPHLVQTPTLRVISRAGDTQKTRQRLDWQPERLELALKATITAARRGGQLS